MIWMYLIGVYLFIMFFLNHAAAQVMARFAEEGGEEPWWLTLLIPIAFITRLPVYVAGIIAYNVCCIATIWAASADSIPERSWTLWCYTLADMVGGTFSALRQLLVRESLLLDRYSKSKWSLVCYDFPSSRTKIFTFSVQEQCGFRRHDYSACVRARSRVGS